LLKSRRQVNRKTLEGSHNPYRSGQFEHINAAVIATRAAGQPAISIDTKKQEPVGSYKNGGSDYRQEGCPDKVNVHDFVDFAPYDVYGVTANAGCVSLGISNDTAQFAVNSIRRWLDVMGRDRCPDMNQLMITADGGGSNGSHVRLFKIELQKLADEIGLTIRVCRYPPGTSKWNKIEHRLFCHITQTWRGKPLISRETVVELIASTTTGAGLTVRCELDTREYPKGIKLSEAELMPSMSRATPAIRNGIIRSPREGQPEAVVFRRRLSDFVAPISPRSRSRASVISGSLERQVGSQPRHQVRQLAGRNSHHRAVVGSNRLLPPCNTIA
jgi:hypothetical protein